MINCSLKRDIDLLPGFQIGVPPLGARWGGILGLCETEATQPNGFTPISQACSRNANSAQAAKPTTSTMASRDPAPAG